MSPPPTNDSMLTPTDVAAIPYWTYGDTTLAGPLDAGEPTPSCGPVTQTVWYRFHSPSATTLGAYFYLANGGRIAVYRGPDALHLQEVACGTQSTAYNPAPATFPSVAGETYWLQMGAAPSGTSGGYLFQFFDATPPPPPGNDNFAAASTITGLPYNTSLNLGPATKEPGEPTPTCTSDAAKTVWYRYTPAADQRVLVTASYPPTAAAIWQGTSLNTLTPVGCTQGSLDIVLTAGTSYMIQLGGPSYASISYLSIREVHQPANDAFATASTVTATPFRDDVGSNLDATKEPGEPVPTCGSIDHTVWYRFTAPASQRIAVSTFGSDFDTLLAVYTGDSLANLSQAGCDDDFYGGGGASRVTLSVSAGTTYWVQAGGWSTQTGQLVVTLSGAVPPANDNFASAQDVTSIPNSSSIPDASDATTEPGEPTPSCSPVSRTVWYRFVAPQDASVALSTAGSSTRFDTVVAAYQGSSLADLHEVGCNDNESYMVRSSRVVVDAVAGQTYWFQVGSRSGSGTLSVVLDRVPPPASDNFADAIGIGYGWPGGTADLAGATLEPGEPSPSCARGSIAHSAWFRFDAPTDADVELDGSGNNVIAAAYEGASLPTLAELTCQTGTYQPYFGWGPRFVAAAGHTYWIQLAVPAGRTGFPAQVILYWHPINDRFVNTVPIAMGDHVHLNTWSAESDVGDPYTSCGSIGKNVWYRFSPTSSGPAVVSTAGSDFDTVVGVFELDSAGHFNQVGCSDDGADWQARASFTALQGHTYYFLAGGYRGDFFSAAGDLHLSVEQGVAAEAAVPWAVSYLVGQVAKLEPYGFAGASVSNDGAITSLAAGGYIGFGNWCDPYYDDCTLPNMLAVAGGVVLRASIPGGVELCVGDLCHPVARHRPLLSPARSVR